MSSKASLDNLKWKVSVQGMPFSLVGVVRTPGVSYVKKVGREAGEEINAEHEIFAQAAKGIWDRSADQHLGIREPVDTSSRQGEDFSSTGQN
jgi:hypothetical protein